MQYIETIKATEVFIKGVESLMKLKFEEGDAQNYLLEELQIADERMPELQLLNNSDIVDYIIDSAIKDVNVNKENNTFSMVYEVAERLDTDYDLNDEQRMEFTQQFIIALRRFMKQKRTKDIGSLTSNIDKRITIENVVDELDMHLLNSKQYVKAQCLLMDVLRSVQLDEHTLGNFKRAYAECFAERNNKVECEACFQRLVEKNPKDTNIVYGWVFQKFQWKEYEACLPLIEKGLKLSDQSYLDMYLELAKDCCKAIKDDSKYNAWKEQYKPQSTNRSIRSAKSSSLDLTLYEDAKPNKPCPCGSGKKFKSCCAKRIQK